MLEIARKYVDEAFKHNKQQIQHFEQTLRWINYLSPNTDEPLQIAAYSHDIERANRDPSIASIPKNRPLGFLDPTFLAYHQIRGARIMKNFLSRQRYNSEGVARVGELIDRHEVGGSPDQNLLMDCDSISFFETQVDNFLAIKVPEVGIEKVRAKFDWMFNRISDSVRKSFARENYRQAIEILKKIS
jgi:hypothetical protein